MAKMLPFRQASRPKLVLAIPFVVHVVCLPILRGFMCVNMLYFIYQPKSKPINAN